MIQTDPFRDLDTLFSRCRVGHRTRRRDADGRLPAWQRRVGAHRPARRESRSLDITVERNVLTVAAERNWQRQEGDQTYFGERYRGSFRRQIQLGDGLDLDHLEADLHDGVLTIRIPVAEQAKPRKVEVGQADNRHPRPSRPRLRRHLVAMPNPWRSDSWTLACPDHGPFLIEERPVSRPGPFVPLGPSTAGTVAAHGPRRPAGHHRAHLRRPRSGPGRLGDRGLARGGDRRTRSGGAQGHPRATGARVR